MEMKGTSSVLENVRRALKRTGPLSAPPVPPVLPEPVVRLVHTDIGLPDLFAKRAGELKMQVEFVTPEEVAPGIVQFLQSNMCRRIGLSESKLLRNLGVQGAIQQAGLAARTWNDLTLDEFYDYDCGITDADYAVAETGTIAILPKPGHGRGISLLPMYHVCVLEPKIFLPDLIDLFEKLSKEHAGRDCTLISGPSKTADIEMNVVTGVHGPNVVKAFILK